MAVIASANCADTRLGKALKVQSPIAKGKSNGAKLVQELLALNGVNVGIDGDYGSGTQTGLDAFCSKQGLPKVTSVDQAMMDRLAQPLLRAVEPVTPTGSLGQTIIKVARQHVAEHPIEIGGANAGPWVRLYMKGGDGVNFLWCAGFVSYIVAAAAKAEGVPSPITSTFSCDLLGAEAKQKGKFTKKMSPSNAPPGSVFLVPSAAHPNDWIHTGIITGSTPGKDVFQTIEGNTNSGGSHNGFEACARIRACAKVDVVLM
jgi:hypothetical protein